MDKSHEIRQSWGAVLSHCVLTVQYPRVMFSSVQPNRATTRHRFASPALLFFPSLQEPLSQASLNTQF